MFPHGHVLTNPNFRNLFFCRVLTILSLQAQAVIVGWYVYELSHDPLMLGLMGLIEAIPAIGFAFVAGHVVDTNRPARVYFWSELILVLSSLLIWITAFESLSVSPSTRIGILFFSMFVSGMVRAFVSPSVFTIISHVIRPEKMSEASAWNSSAYQLAAIVGPALGGLLYGHFPPAIVFALPPLIMIAALLLILNFSADIRKMVNSSAREPFLTSIHSGIQFALKQKALLATMMLDMFSVLFGGATAVLPVFADQVLHSGPSGLGLMRAAPSFGSALVLLWLGFKPLRVISGKMLMVMVAGFGLSIIGFALSTSFIPAFVFLAASGAFDGVSMVIRGTILQLLTPIHMRGRISSLSLIFITSSNEIGAFESGLAARVLGLIPSLLFGGAMTMAIVFGTAVFSPSLRNTRIDPRRGARAADA